MNRGQPDDSAGFVFGGSASNAPVVRCRNVTRAYRRDARGARRGSGWDNEAPTVVALDNVSLEVFPGEVVGISGPSGSGKSTLIHLLGALDAPTSGTVEVAGTDVGSVSERGRTRLRLEHVGIVFQNFYLLPSLTASQNVALPLIESGVGRRDRRERATGLLDRVGLADRVGHRPGELSGGEQQRVAIARALVNDPDLLLADEPTGELDSATGRRVIDLLTEFSSDRAVVLASHDDQVLTAADRVLRLLDGRLAGGQT